MTINKRLIKNKSIDMFNSNYSLLSEREMRSIKGGDWIDDMFNNIFDYSQFLGSPSPTITTFLNTLKADFRDLASTTVGANLLESLNSKILLDPSTNKIKLNPNSLINMLDSGNYNYNTNVMSFDISSVLFFNKDHFTTFAHELYHAYRDIVINQNAAPTLYDNDVKSELDAGIFETMVAIQFDKDHSISSTDPNSRFSKVSNYSKYDPREDTNAHDLFKNAWDDIFVNGNFTLNNYNTLIANFKTGSLYGISDPAYVTGLTNTSELDLDVTTIDEEFNIFFKNNYITSSINLYNNFNPNNFSLYDNIHHYYIAASSYWNPSEANTLEQNLETFLNSCLGNGVTVKYNDVIICDASSYSGSGGPSNNDPNTSNAAVLQGTWGVATPANFFNTFGLFVYTSSSSSSSSSGSGSGSTSGSGTTGGTSGSSWNGVVNWHSGNGPDGLEFYFNENNQPLSPEEKRVRGLPVNNASE